MNNALFKTIKDTYYEFGASQAGHLLRDVLRDKECRDIFESVHAEAVKKRMNKSEHTFGLNINLSFTQRLAGKKPYGVRRITRVKKKRRVNSH